VQQQLKQPPPPHMLLPLQPRQQSTTFDDS
jgi:hypothetical protein